MTDMSKDGQPPRTAPRARDWFAPPAAQPTSEPVYTGPPPQLMPILVPGTLSAPRDRRVWPPEEPEPEGEERSTQPFPAVRENRPLPMPLRRAVPHVPNRPGTEPDNTGPAGPHPTGPGLEIPEPGETEPGNTAPDGTEPDGREPDNASTDNAGPDKAGPDNIWPDNAGQGDTTPRHRQEAPDGHADGHGAGPGKKRSRRRGVLIGAGAVLSVALAVGLPVWFRYNVYEYGQPADQVHLVQPGKAGVLQHVSWQVSLERIPDPTGKPDASDRQWMKVVATRTALDGEGATRHAPPEVSLTDRAGRTWHTEKLSDDTPIDVKDNRVGTPYRMELVGVVPPAVADQVEVLVRPNTSRDVPGQSVDDMMKSAAISTEKLDQVLRFRR